MIIYICNAFSPGMLNREHQDREESEEAGFSGRRRILTPVEDPREFISDWISVGAEVKSIVGHSDTATLFSGVLGFPVGVNRIGIRLDSAAGRSEEIVLIGQVVAKDGGPYRLPSGATELPPDASIEWWVV